MKKLVTLLIVCVSFLYATDIESWKNDFIKAHGNFGQTDDHGRTFYYGEATINVTPLDPAYVKELVLAYEKAMLNLQSDFILQTFGRETVQRLAEIVENDSTNADQFPPLPEAQKMAQQGKIATIFNKALDVIDKKLDKELEELGVPPQQLQKMTVEQKKTLFKDKLSSKIVKEAFSSMEGLVPYQVKIGTITTPVGKATKVAIIAITSPKTIQFAKDIARQRPTQVRGKPHTLSDLLPKAKEDYLNEIGLRYSYDEQGRPMLISYGMWSVTQKVTSPSRYLKKIDLAKRKARMRAESYIGDFIKTNIQAIESQDASSLEEEVAKKITTVDAAGNSSQKIRDNIKETLDSYFKKFKSSSNFSLQGTSEAYNWDYKEPKTGMIYVGSVVTWNYNQLNNVKRYIHQKHNTAKTTKTQAKTKSSVTIERESKVINDVEDF
ncbi:DUF6844 domain-containing protein [Nitratiruptor sp. SB155-2]|uniref:DUF6844 domain-containing protein n=1 Tax=Nitratiruptor sp. (strain SB155-2) TaxID=387092 RepID=UPI0001586FAD|nr:hypothetical protein [Nitratiruptor sp. SB155-2]BAF70802.1 conserved hypothetical protein [Nitratiruptor sp. SB155-2]